MNTSIQHWATIIFFYGEKQHLFNDIRKEDFRRQRYSLVHNIRLKKTSWPNVTEPVNA